MQDDRTATIVHALPGRMRIRFDRDSRSFDLLHSLRERLSEVKGVSHVQVNPTTGSLLLLYDPDSLVTEELYLAAKAANVTVLLAKSEEPSSSAEETSPVASSINSAFARLDRAVARFTGGTVDAKTLVPLGLGAAALRQILASGANLATAPWYVLLWYSFEIFTKYNVKR